MSHQIPGKDDLLHKPPGNAGDTESDDDAGTSAASQCAVHWNAMLQELQ